MVASDDIESSAVNPEHLEKKIDLSPVKIYYENSFEDCKSNIYQCLLDDKVLVIFQKDFFGPRRTRHGIFRSKVCKRIVDIISFSFPVFGPLRYPTNRFADGT